MCSTKFKLSSQWSKEKLRKQYLQRSLMRSCYSLLEPIPAKSNGIWVASPGSRASLCHTKSYHVIPRHTMSYRKGHIQPQIYPQYPCKAGIIKLNYELDIVDIHKPTELWRPLTQMCYVSNEMRRFPQSLDHLVLIPMVTWGSPMT